MWMHICTCVHVHAEAQINRRHFHRPQLLVTPTFFFNARVSLPSRLGWLTSEHQGAACLCLPVLGLHVHAEMTRFLKIIYPFRITYILYAYIYMAF